MVLVVAGGPVYAFAPAKTNRRDFPRRSLRNAAVSRDRRETAREYVAIKSENAGPLRVTRNASVVRSSCRSPQPRPGFSPGEQTRVHARVRRTPRVSRRRVCTCSAKCFDNITCNNVVFSVYSSCVLARPVPVQGAQHGNV